MGGPTAARQERLSILRQHIFCVTRCKLVTFRYWFEYGQKLISQNTKSHARAIHPTRERTYSACHLALYTLHSTELETARGDQGQTSSSTREAYSQSTHHGSHTWAHSTTFKVEPQHREVGLGYLCNVSPSLVNSASEVLTVVEKTQWPGPTDTPCHWVGLGGHGYDGPFAKAKAEQQRSFIVSL